MVITWQQRTVGEYRIWYAHEQRSDGWHIVGSVEQQGHEYLIIPVDEHGRQRRVATLTEAQEVVEQALVARAARRARKA